MEQLIKSRQVEIGYPLFRRDNENCDFYVGNIDSDFGFFENSMKVSKDSKGSKKYYGILKSNLKLEHIINWESVNTDSYDMSPKVYFIIDKFGKIEDISSKNIQLSSLDIDRGEDKIVNTLVSLLKELSMEIRDSVSDNYEFTSSEKDRMRKLFDFAQNRDTISWDDIIKYMGLDFVNTRSKTDELLDILNEKNISVEETYGMDESTKFKVFNNVYKKFNM